MLEAESERSELVADVDASESDRLVVDDVCVTDFDVVDASLWNVPRDSDLEDVAAEEEASLVVGVELLAKLAVSGRADEDTLDVALLDGAAPERNDDASEKGAVDDAEEEVVRSGIELVLFVDDASAVVSGGVDVPDVELLVAVDASVFSDNVDDALENAGVDEAASELLVAISSATTTEAPKRRLPTMTPKTDTMTVLRIWISTLRTLICRHHITLSPKRNNRIVIRYERSVTSMLWVTVSAPIMPACSCSL